MDLVTYLRKQLTGKPYEWSIDVSYSGSVYINYQFGTDEQEDEGYVVSASIRFSNHDRPPIVSPEGHVYEHNYLKDFRVTEQGISKGYVDAILKYADLIVLKAYAELKALENDPTLNYIGIHWDNTAFRKVRDSMIEQDNYESDMLFIGAGY